MRKSIGIILLLLCCTFLSAQELTEAEVSQILTDAFTQNKAGNYQAALEGFLKVGENTKMQRTEAERQVYVGSQTMAVFCFEQLKQYDKGIQLSETLLQGKLLDNEREDIQHLYVMNGYFKATSCLKKTSRRYTDAREVLTKVLPYADGDMKSKILQKIPLSWYFEGTQYQIGQQYDEALSCIEKARKGFHEIGDFKDELDAFCQLGSIKNFTYDALGAQEAYQQAESLARSSGNDVKLISILRELRKISKQIGNTELSTRLDNEMDSLIAQAGDGKVKFEYYNYKGDEAVERKQYQLAESWYKKNESFIQQLNTEHVGAERYTYYTNLRNLYAKIGKYQDALDNAYRSKIEFQHLNTETDKHYYMPYMGISDIYRLRGDSLKCFQSIDTLFLSKDRLEEPKELEQLYITRARSYSAFKRYDLALKDYQTTDALLGKKYPESDGDRVRLLPLLGGCYHKLEQYDESERSYRRYADYMKVMYGENSSGYIDALTYLANAEGFANHIEEGCSHYAVAVEKLKDQVQKRLPYYTQAERDSYWGTISDVMTNMTPFALKANRTQTAFTQSCYDALVLSKAFLLETERSTYDIIKKYGNADDLHDYSMISSMQAKIKKWETNYTHNADSILWLTSKANAIEKRLTNRCRSYGNIAEFMNVGYEEIKTALGDENVLIDFTDFVSESRGRVYAAYIVNKQLKYPLLQELFQESVIDSMQITNPDMYYDYPCAEKIYELLWKPFAGQVREGATVYYVPSQLLFQLAIESIPMPDGSLLGEHFNFVRLSSAREIVRIKQQLDLANNNGVENAILYGGLQYYIDPKAMVEEAAKYEISPLLATRGEIVRGDSIYRELPETKKEVEAIERALNEKGLKVKPCYGMNGTEESFLSMNGKAPQILHVATHGFYYTPEEAEQYDYLRGYADAMSLSGIVLSGGNAAWLGKELPKGVLGGILTAANIARLDLTGLELVVLSACQTGRGRATSEGLFGLQRAFKKAGAKTMVMTLWSVSDVVTKEFMIKFYENLADNNSNWNKRKAFDDAKSYIKSKYEDPYYWAGFVMLD